jgi:hypothetical protein
MPTSGVRKTRPLRVLPTIELAVFALRVATPFVLSARTELITLMTNFVILSLLMRRSCSWPVYSCSGDAFRRR